MLSIEIDVSIYLLYCHNLQICGQFQQQSSNNAEITRVWFSVNSSQMVTKAFNSSIIITLGYGFYSVHCLIINQSFMKLLRI